MGINHRDGQFAIDLYVTEDDEESSATEYSDTLPPLQKRAELLIASGRFGYVELSRWNADKQDWDDLKQYYAT